MLNKFKVEKLDLKKFEVISSRYFETIQEAQCYCEELEKSEYGYFLIKVNQVVLGSKTERKDNKFFNEQMDILLKEAEKVCSISK